MKKSILLVLLILTGCITVYNEEQNNEQPIPEPLDVDTITLAGSWTGDFSEIEDSFDCKVRKTGEATFVFRVDEDTFEGTFFAQGSQAIMRGPELCGGDFAIGGSMDGNIGGSELTGVFYIDSINIEIPFTATYTENDLVGSYKHSVPIEGEYTEFEGVFFLDKK